MGAGEDFVSHSRPIELNLTRRKVVSNILMLFSGSAISQGLTALALILIARGVGPAQYGEYASATVLATLLSILFSLGLDTWLLREGGSRPAEIGSLAGSVLAVKVGLGAVWLAMMFAIARYLPGDSFTTPVLRLATLIILLDSLLTTFQAIFKAALLNQITSALVVGSDLAWFIATLVYYLQGGREVVVYMQIRVVVLLLSEIAGGVIFWRRYMPHINLPHLARIRKEFFPYFTSDLLMLALLRVDVLIISLTLGKEATGLYSPAVSLIYAMYLIPTAIQGVMLPVLSNLFANRSKHAWKTAYRIVGIQTIAGFFLTAGVYLTSPLLVNFLGPAYINSLGIIKILSFNLIFRGISYAMVAIIVANNQQSKRTIVQLITVFVNITLNLAVVYWAGIRGVAVVYVIAEAIQAIGYSLLTLLIYKNKSTPSNFP